MRHILLISCIFILSNCGAERKEETSERIKNIKVRAEEFISKSDFQSAIACCNEVLELDSNDAETYRQRAQFYGYIANQDTVNKQWSLLQLKDLDKAILLNPSSDNYIARAEFREQKKEFVRALADYKLAVNYSPVEEKWKYLKQRANFNFFNIKDSSAAFLDMKEAINSAVDLTAKVNLKLEYARMMMKCRRFSEAQNLLVDCYIRKDLLKTDPFSEKGLVSFTELAICRIELGDFYGALCQLEGEIVYTGYEKLLKGYCLVKLGQKEIGMNLMKIGAQGQLSSENEDPLHLDNYSAIERGEFSKYFLEIFPEYRPRTKKSTENFNWPN